MMPDVSTANQAGETSSMDFFLAELAAADAESSSTMPDRGYPSR